MIDRIVRYRETRRNISLRKVGLERLGYPLKLYLIFWYRCGALTNNLKSLESVRSVVTKDTFIAALKAKNFGDPDGTRKKWFDRLKQLRDQFKIDLAAILSVYITVLEAEDVRLIDYFLRPSGMDYQIEYGTLAPNPDENILFKNVIPASLTEYMDKLGRLVELHNSVADTPMDDANIWILNRLPEFWTSDKEETANFLSQMTPALFNEMVFDVEGGGDNTS